MKEGQLTFDVNSGKFWITNPEDFSPLASLEFGDEFEVALPSGEWVKTNLVIGNNEQGDLIFKLKNTPYEGQLDGIQARV